MTSTPTHYRWQDSDLLLFCHCQPKAKKDEFAGLHNGLLKIRLTAPPVDGKANKHLIGFIAKAFKVPKSQVTLISGDQSRQKQLKISAPQILPEGCHIDSSNN